MAPAERSDQRLIDPNTLELCKERVRSLKECFRVSALINSTLELDVVLERLMTTCREILKADACSLMLVEEETGELVFTVAQGPVAGQLKTGFRLPKDSGIAGHVFQTGEPMLVENAYDEPLFHRDFDSRTGYHTRSILCVPLYARERIIGLTQVINRLDGKPFNAEDLETLSLISAHAATAIENARMHTALMKKQRMESDLAFATTVQQSFLPQTLPELPGMRFRAFYKAALEVGGDFYDFIPVATNRMGILIGDVAGKGVASALYMAKLTSDTRLLAVREHDPVALVERINDLLCERSRRGMFATLLYMTLDAETREIEFVNAGHLPPVIWNAPEGRYQILKAGGGPPAGILPGCKYTSSRYILSPNDVILLATDGVVEAKGSGEERFGWERLEVTLRSGPSSADALYDRLGEAISRFTGDESPVDDTTVVLLSVEGHQPCH